MGGYITIRCPCGVTVQVPWGRCSNQLVTLAMEAEIEKLREKVAV